MVLNSYIQLNVFLIMKVLNSCKLTIFLICFLFSSFNILAQTLKVEKGPRLKTKSFQNQLISSSKNGYLFLGEDGHARRELMYWYSKKNESWKRVYKSKVWNPVIGSLVSEDKLVNVVLGQKGGEKIIHGILIDKKTGKELKNEIIVQNPRSNKTNIWNTIELYGFEISDNDKVLSVGKFDLEKNGGNNFHIDEYDSLLVKKSSIKLNLDVDLESVELECFKPIGGGKYILITSQVSKNKKNKKRSRYHNVNHKLHVVSKFGYEVILIPESIGNIDFLSIEFSLNKNQIIITGKKADENMKNFSYVYCVFNLLNNKLDLLGEYSLKDIIDCQTGDNQYRNVNFCKPKYFSLNEIIFCADGYVMIYENIYRKLNQDHTYGSIIIQKINFKGEVIFSKLIPKKQRLTYPWVSGQRYLNSYIYLIKNDRLVLIFTDSKKNYEEESIVEGINLIKRSYVNQFVVGAVNISMKNGHYTREIILEKDVNSMQLWGLNANGFNRVSEFEVNTVIRYKSNQVMPIKFSLE